MKKLIMEIEFDYDAEIMHGDEPEAIEWFMNDVLRGADLYLSDFGDIGDELGRVTVRSIREDK